METKRLFKFSWMVMALAVLSSPLTSQSQAEALPAGVPGARCGTLSNPTIGTLCYTVTPGGGKVNAHGDPKDFPAVIIQATEPEYVIAEVILEITSVAGDRNLPSVSQLSPGGQASVVTQATEKLRELKQTRAELQAKATVLSGPALIEAQAKLSNLQEEERSFEKKVETAIAAGQDAGKFQVSGASARSRKCGTPAWDTCGSWVEYNIYVVKRYIGDPIAAYNRAFAVANDAKNTITRLVEENQRQSVQPSSPACVSVDSKNGWQTFNLPGQFSRIVGITGAWTILQGNHSFVGASGYAGEEANILAPYNDNKADRNSPFGALLVQLPNSGNQWISSPQSLNQPISQIAMRINDADGGLGDNSGALQVCFGN